MDSDQFVAKLNRIAADLPGELPVLDGQKAPSSGVIAAWAAFLQRCVKAGIHISDERWQSLSMTRRGGVVEFSLEQPGHGEPDEDFRVGLQLLMGMLGESDDR